MQPHKKWVHSQHLIRTSSINPRWILWLSRKLRICLPIRWIKRWWCSRVRRILVFLRMILNHRGKLWGPKGTQPKEVKKVCSRRMVRIIHSIIPPSPLKRNHSWPLLNQNSIAKPQFKMIWISNCLENSSVDQTLPTRSWRTWQISRLSCRKAHATGIRYREVTMPMALDHLDEVVALKETHLPPEMPVSWIKVMLTKLHPKRRKNKSS